MVLLLKLTVTHDIKLKLLALFKETLPNFQDVRKGLLIHLYHLLLILQKFGMDSLGLGWLLRPLHRLLIVLWWLVGRLLLVALMLISRRIIRPQVPYSQRLVRRLLILSVGWLLLLVEVLGLGLERLLHLTIGLGLDKLLGYLLRHGLPDLGPSSLLIRGLELASVHFLCRCLLRDILALSTHLVALSRSKTLPLPFRRQF